MAGLNIHFRIRIPRSWVRWGTTGSLLLALAPELATESVTLTSYYPAPKGVYANLMTTGNSYLARDGGAVGIATASPDSSSKLHVVGLTIMQNDGPFLEGRDGTGLTRFRIQNDAAATLNFLGRDNTGLFSFMTVNNSGSQAVNFPTTVSIGHANPAAAPSGRGTLDVGGEGIMIARQQCADPTRAYPAGGTGSPCDPGQYPTVISGIMTRFVNAAPGAPNGLYGPTPTLDVSKSGGHLICCQCPPGASPCPP